MKTPNSRTPLPGEPRVTFFQVVLFVFSLLTLAGLFVRALLPIPQEAAKILRLLDTTVCTVFIVDFAIRWRAADNNAAFWKWAWIDLLASIPNLDHLRWGRTVHIFKMFMLLRSIRSFQRIVKLLFNNRLRSGVGSVIVASFLLVIFSAMAILIFESRPESNIKSAEDALWWSVTTITTVGYGDRYPVTLEGRIIAAILMISGVGMFGTLSGVIASHFLGPSKATSDSDVRSLLAEIRSLHKKIEELQNPGLAHRQVHGLPANAEVETGRDSITIRSNKTAAPQRKSQG